jgi:toxin ParE1/3/4
MSRIIKQALACRERTELEPPVRIYHHGHHLVVYLALEDGVNLVRFLHESMDVDSHLEDS